MVCGWPGAHFLQAKKTSSEVKELPGGCANVPESSLRLAGGLATRTGRGRTDGHVAALELTSRAVNRLSHLRLLLPSSDALRVGILGAGLALERVIVREAHCVVRELRSFDRYTRKSGNVEEEGVVSVQALMTAEVCRTGTCQHGRFNRTANGI